MTRRIYAASSWRNQYYDGLVAAMRHDGHEVYNFRRPEDGTGFKWSEIAGNFPDRLESTDNFSISGEEFVKLLNHPRARAGFKTDFKAMLWADTFVLILPCGRSAHLELGWACGTRKQTAILLDSVQEPELMYSMVDAVLTEPLGLQSWLNSL